ncbi:MAG: hypothetical protein IJY66_02725 [Clostridia bacterium]|nr:hypothetical protein [Clostridia bacterium]
MFKKNRTIWGIAALVSSYLSLFIAVAFIGENKRVSLKMLLMSITQLICGLALIDDEYELGDKVKEKSTAAVGAVKAKSVAAAGAVKEKSQAVAAKVKSKLHTPVMDADEELFDEGDIYDIEEAICDDLGADEE